jgi:hypothetical protein
MARTALVGLALALAAAGCSGGGGEATVSGTVKLDGRPLKAGLIKFIPADGKTPTADATITDGKYTATVPPGDKRVEVTAPKVVGKMKMYDTPDSPTVDQVEELLPKRYNTASELTYTVTAGSQTKDFDLQGGK